jgi:DNA-binding NarL/FixJ family response regulator
MQASVAALVAEEEGLDLVGEVSDGGQLVGALERLRPDVLLLDVGLMGMDLHGLLAEIGNRLPQLKTIVLGDSDEAHRVSVLFSLGVVCYVRKEVRPSDLVAAIRLAEEGTVEAVTPALRESLSGRLASTGLTPRELEILSAAARGESNRQIARSLWLTEPTIKFHLANVYRKLGAANRTQAARMAYELGLGTDHIPLAGRVAQ